MLYDAKPWQTLFEKMDAQDHEIFHQVPQIIYEYAEKHLHTATTKENLVMYQNSLRLNSNVFMSKPKSVVCISNDLE